MSQKKQYDQLMSWLKTRHVKTPIRVTEYKNLNTKNKKLC